MKPLSTLLLAILLTACTACTMPQPEPPAPPPTPTPAPVIVANYTIREYDGNGNVKRTFTDVPTFKEQAFPRSVTFHHDGQLITLSGSYQISRLK